MNKNAIKKFAIDARNKLIDSVTDKAGMLGITKDACSEPITKGADFEVYQTAAGTEVTLDKKQCEHRRKLVEQIKDRGFDAVVEEVAYTWFNRICAIRFMEVNDYMYPARVRVLSSEKKSTVSGLVKNEPDILTQAPDIDWDFTDEEREYIIDAKMNNKLDDLFRMLFIKQCNLLHEVLPGLFEETDDYTEMLLNISFTNEDDVIRMLVDGIDEADFNVSTHDENGIPTGQVEIIGWLYQYYNTELKDDTFAKLKKNIKISKERIPAATQLFTPDWIVRYMVENSVGRIWIDHLRAVDPSVNEKETAERFGWKYYLPEAEQEEEVNVKLAEIRTTYKDLKPTDITCIDPCMGSGHILIAMFDVLMDIYESAGYDKRESAFEIVEHNIHGLDIDKRAYQLAYFAVMMKGREYNRRFFCGRDDVKPMPKVYAILESNDIVKNHLELFGQSMDTKQRETAKEQMEYLIDTFNDGREYGSILNVEECDWELLQEFVEDLNMEGQCNSATDVQGQIAFDSYKSDVTQEKLRMLVKVAKNLGQKYDAVVTNPPYMGIRGMDAKLNTYVSKIYPNTKSDLFSVFIDVAYHMTRIQGIYSMITQPSLLSLATFSDLRTQILLENTILSMLHMGRGVFGVDFGSVSFAVRNDNVFDYCGEYFRLHERTFQYIEIDDIKNIFLKAKEKHTYKQDFSLFGDLGEYETESVNQQIGESIIYYKVQQNRFSAIPGKPFAYWMSNEIIDLFGKKCINDYATVTNGLFTCNNNRFLRLWHEVEFNNVFLKCKTFEESINDDRTWYPYNKGGNYRKWYGNQEYVVNFKHFGEEISNYRIKSGQSASFPGQSYYFKESLSWSFISAGKFGIRYYPYGFVFDIAGSSVFPNSETSLFPLLAVLGSEITSHILQILNPTMNYQVGNVRCLPIAQPVLADEILKQLAIENVELSKKEWDSFENSWEFVRHPLMNKTKISDAYDYWNKICIDRFNQLKNNEQAINMRLLELYNIHDNSIGVVEDKDVTVRKADLGREIRSFISYAVGCMFGRYSIDKDGLMVAGQPFGSVYYEATAPRAGTGVAGAPGEYLPTGEYYIQTEDGTKKCTFNPDRDNIIPITDEEYFSDDIVGRFVEFVEVVYGKDTLEENLDFIAQALGTKGNSSREVIRNYFIKDFYKDHLKVYQKRPIYWLFDSGKQNGFKALVYMHRYDADTVGRVRTDYLHRAQNYVETAKKSAEYTIENATVASEKSKAMKAVAKYTKQLAEMQTYDQAIAHVANQRIEIDLDDGVKVNYAKFQGVEVAQEGKKALKVDLLGKI